MDAFNILGLVCKQEAACSWLGTNQKLTALKAYAWKPCIPAHQINSCSLYWVRKFGASWKRKISVTALL